MQIQEPKPPPKRQRRALASVAAITSAALILSCLLVYRGTGRTELLHQDKLSRATTALEKDLAHQHNVGSKVKAWVAASAMKGPKTQLKPARMQELFDFDADGSDGVGMALPMFDSEGSQSAETVEPSLSVPLADSFSEPQSSQSSSALRDTMGAVASVAEQEDGLRRKVQQQSKMIKKLHDTVGSLSSVAEQEDGLTTTVERQAQTIKKLQRMLEERTSKESKRRNAAPEKAQKAAVSEQEGQSMPTLGSWDMAKAAGTSEFGTNVVHMYGDLKKSGKGVTVNNPYVSGIKAAKAAHGEPDFSDAREENTDYWNEDEEDDDTPAVTSAPPKAQLQHRLEPRPAEPAPKAHADFKEDATQRPRRAAKPASKPMSINAIADEDDSSDGLDTKPAIDSWEMAKFANNVEAGSGTMGTNIVHMYDSLSKRGPYKQVESESPLDKDDEDEERFDEYKPKHGARQQVLAKADSAGNNKASAAAKSLSIEALADEDDSSGR